jgi:hypothetical protein
MTLHAFAFDAMPDDGPTGAQDIETMTTIVLDERSETRGWERPRSASKPIEISNQLLGTEGFLLQVCRAFIIVLPPGTVIAMASDAAHDLLYDHMRRQR